MGDGTTTDRTTPVAVVLPVGVTGFTTFAAGYTHSLGLGSDGKLYSWSFNDGAFTPGYIPAAVTLPAEITSFSSFAAGYNHNLGVGSNGRLYAWGDNGDGQLGNGTTNYQPNPVLVSLLRGVNGFGPITASGHRHTIVLVNPLDPLTSSPNPATVGSSVTFTVTMQAITATGTVSFTFGTGPSAITATATLANGVATYVTNTLPVGNIPVTVSYGGGASFLPASSPVYTQTITKTASSLSVSSTPNPSSFGQPATFTATVQPAAATGTVTFTIGAATVTATLAGGVATYVTSTLTSGDYAVSASYGGSPAYSSSLTAGQYTHTVQKLPTSLSVSSSPNPAVVGSSVTFTATIQPVAATGTVTFTIGTATVTAFLANGVATYVTNTLQSLNTPVTVSYSGDASMADSTSPVYIQTVSRVATSLGMTSSLNPAVVGSSVTFTATLSPVEASGLVTFTFNGLTTTTSPLIDGVATYVTDTLPVGTYTVMVSYYGEAANQRVSSSEEYTQLIVPTCNPQLVTSSEDDGKATTCGTFSYALTSTTSGTISFALPDGGNIITFTGSLTPTLQPGVKIDGGISRVILEGNGVAGDGLRLGGNNLVANLIIRNFGGRQLLAPAGTSPNQFYRVRLGW